MINLLFISNSPRAELLRGHFQQRLRVRFDVVADYDHGLKDVFEKRPATVCIQDQIAGVSGESVARHIQLLLGSSAPTFILMHDGNPKARPVPGLFSHLIDLSGHFDAVCGGFEKIMRPLLGEQWEQLQIAAEPVVEPVIPVITASAVANVPVEMPQSDVAAEVVPSFDDLLEHAEPGGPKPEIIRAVAPLKSESEDSKEVLSETPVSESEQLVEVAAPRPTVAVMKKPEPPLQPVAAPTTSAAPETLENQDLHRIDGDLLIDFEDSYDDRRGGLLYRVLLLLVAVVGLCALLYLLMSWTSAIRRLERPASSVPQPVAKAAVQLPASSARQPAKAVEAGYSLPAFVPVIGLDPSFGAKSPGWSRYFGPGRDYRLFHDGGRLVAAQVLAVGKEALSEAELLNILKELTGSEQYKISSVKQVDGLLLEKAFAGRNELQVYRSSSNKGIRAIVVALQ